MRRGQPQQQQPAAAAAAAAAAALALMMHAAIGIVFGECATEGSVQMKNKTNLRFKSDEHLGHRLRTVAKNGG